MVELPLPLLVDSLTPFNVCFFKDTAFPEDSSGHYYIVINKDHDRLLLVWIFSDWKSRQDRYLDQRDANCIVQVTKEEFDFLKYESGIDCNHYAYLTKEQLIQRIHPECKFEIIKRDIPQKIKQEIISAMKRSRIVPKTIRRLLPEQFD